MGYKKSAEVGRKANIRAIKPKKHHYYPNTGKLHKKADNLLKRDFNQQKINTHWVGDITYIKTYQGWSYLASVLDLASRQVVGWYLYIMQWSFYD